MAGFITVDRKRYSLRQLGFGANAWGPPPKESKRISTSWLKKTARRTRGDMVKQQVFENLESQIQKCDHVKTYVDKFIAHAAAPETREDLQTEEEAMTLERLEACYRTLYCVASFISGSLLWDSSLGGLPVPQFDHLKDIEKRWVSPRNVGKARETWRAFEEKVSGWDSTDIWPEGFVRE